MNGRLSWQRVLGEGTAIVVSILLALAIQEWWENRAERDVERAYLVRLRDELSAGLPVLEATHARILRAQAAVDTLLDSGLLETANDRARLADLVRRAGSYEVSAEVITLDQTYQEMLATGSLALIRDLQVREAITQYYYQVAFVRGNLAAGDLEGFRRFASRVRGATGRNTTDTTFRDGDVDRLADLVSGPMIWQDELRFTHSRLGGLLSGLAELNELSRSLVSMLSSS